MPIIKAGAEISSLQDWEERAGPKSPSQWVDGRSAKESARAWLEGKGKKLPNEIISALESNPYFGSVQSWLAEPEAKLRFDSFASEPRNSDLAVHTKDANGSYIMAVEAKADESFGETVSQTMVAAQNRLKGNPRSNGVTRLEHLRTAILGIKPEEELRDAEIRYQLLTACAGALCEAERNNYSRALMLVHEFITDKTLDANHKRNAKDLSDFVRRLSGEIILAVETGVIYGPFKVHGIPILKTDINLFIGKVSRNMRVSKI